MSFDVEHQLVEHPVVRLVERSVDKVSFPVLVLMASGKTSLDLG